MWWREEGENVTPLTKSIQSDDGRHRRGELFVGFFVVAVSCCFVWLLSHVVSHDALLLLLSHVVVVSHCCCLTLLLSHVVVVSCCCCCCLMLLSHVVVVVAVVVVVSCCCCCCSCFSSRWCCCCDDGGLSPSCRYMLILFLKRVCACVSFAAAVVIK